MRLQRVITNCVVLAAAVAAPFAVVPVQAAVDMIEGVVVTREADKLVLRQKKGTMTTVTMTKSTKIAEFQGPLGIGILTASMGAEMLVPGLKVTVEPESAAQPNVAKTVSFTTSDLEQANAIQAALAVPQQQIQALTQELAGQKQLNADRNAAQDKEIAAGKMTDAAIIKRFGDLADYDQKGEINILFDVNGVTLSDKAKADLKEFAAKAKTYRGYLIQVAGYADAVGSASRNQVLSDNRAATVVRYLQQECDVGLSRVLSPIAMGEAKPVAPNETAQGRAENRRVTVRIGVNRGIGE